MRLTELPTVAWSVSRALAERCDALPVSPQSIGSRLLHRTWQQRERRAAQDPDWVAIEQLRGPDGDVELDLSVGLDLSSRRVQDELAERAYPDLWWLPVAWWLSGASAADALVAGRHLAQRVVRGWSEADVAELASVLPVTVGAQLLALAEQAERRAPHPDDPDHAAAASFVERLRAHGRTLASQGDPDEECARSLSAWHDVATTPGHDPVLEAHLSAAHDRAVAEASRAVRESLVWVADHLDELYA